MSEAQHDPVERPENPCRNCGDPTPGQYCPTCGQKKEGVRVSLREMLADFLEDQFVLDQRLPRTLAALLFHPGRLTTEHIEGRIVRYVRPLKLYLASSVVFFLLLSFFSLRAIERASVEGPDGEAAAAEDPAATVEAAKDSAALVGIDSLLADTTLPATARPILSATRRGVARRLGRVDSTAAEPGRDLLLSLGDSLHTGIARVDSVLARRVRTLAAMEPREAIERVLQDFLGYVPTMMFILLPIFALVLKLLYLRGDRYYTEHFIFLLHTQTFVFVIFMLLLLLGEAGLLPAWLKMGLLGWAAAYVFLALRRVYGQGRFVTFVKWWTLGWAYFWILAISIPIAFVTTILLL